MPYYPNLEIFGWGFLGEGTYNLVYRQRPWVFKLRKYPEDKTNKPGRSIRLWNLINGETVGKAKPFSIHYYHGWVAPYVSGKNANSDQRDQLLIDVYQKTGRIILDIVVPENCKVTKEGTVVCIDVGMALLLEQTVNPVNSGKELQRENSSISRNFWKKERGIFEGFFDEYYKRNKRSVELIMALIFIQKYMPDITDANFLLEKETDLDPLYKSGKQILENNEAKNPKAIIAKVNTLRTKPPTAKNEPSQPSTASSSSSSKNQPNASTPGASTQAKSSNESISSQSIFEPPEEKPKRKRRRRKGNKQGSSTQVPAQVPALN